MGGKIERWENLVEGEDLKKARLARSKRTTSRRIRDNELPAFESKGWESVSSYKNGDVKIEKRIPFDEEFENRVWLMLCAMGFKKMNRDNSFNIGYSKSDPGLTKQIDVFAMDEETILIFECKTAKKQKTSAFLDEIGEFADKIEGIRQSLFKQFGKGRQIRFVWATANYNLGSQDEARLNQAKMAYFREEDVEYFTELAKHLGESAKYQLLGKLFSKQKIPEMPETVPAIKGFMGKHTYYSFSIEPERLLKIAFVLHRSDANYNLMPTYQRVIKKSRLKEIREFVEQGGYFPNSIIISIENKRGGKNKELQFDEVSAKATDSNVKLGILHLPQLYCSAYIIDGQHRLYGYTGTQYAKSNTIPVVAFENLERAEQVRLFMEINQNQKQVPLNLRNTLNASLLYDSPNPIECRIGLRSKIAQQLGEDPNSPLFNHVIVGENKRNDYRCVTLESIDKGLRDGHLLTDFGKDGSVIRQGLLDSYEKSNDYAYGRLIPFLYSAFDFLKEELPEEWEKGQSNQGLLTNNTGIYALIHCFSDIVEFLQSKKEIDTRTVSDNQLIDSCHPYLQAIVDFYKTMTDEMAVAIRDNYGGNGSRDHWRYLQKGIREQFSPFNPDGLDNWWEDHSKARNKPAQQRLEVIDVRVREITKAGLFELFGDDWEDKLPETLLVRYAAEVAKSKRAHRTNPAVPEKTYWDCVTLDDCRTIALDGSNWSSWFKTQFTRPGSPRGRKDDATSWIENMAKIRRELQRGKGKSVSVSEFDHICAIADWLCPEVSFDNFDEN